MPGPIDVRNVVLCTSSAGGVAARYALARLAHGLPDVNLHVFFQSGHEFNSPSAGGNTRVLRLKRRYWALRGKLRHPGRTWRKRRLSRWTRRAEAELAGQTPAVRRPVHEHQVNTINDHLQAVEDIRPDVLLIYSGSKVSPEVLAAATVALNIHCGKLPEYRGVRSAVVALAEGNYDQVGVTLHVATTGLDAGPIVRWQHVPPGEAPSIGGLTAELTRVGFDLAVETIRRLADGPLVTTPQVGQPRMYRGRDLNAEVCRRAERNFQALTRPGPAASPGTAGLAGA